MKFCRNYSSVNSEIIGIAWAMRETGVMPQMMPNGGLPFTKHILVLEMLGTFYFLDEYEVCLCNNSVQQCIFNLLLYIFYLLPLVLKYVSKYLLSTLHVPK